MTAGGDGPASKLVCWQPGLVRQRPFPRNGYVFIRLTVWLPISPGCWCSDLARSKRLTKLRTSVKGDAPGQNRTLRGYLHLRGTERACAGHKTECLGGEEIKTGWETAVQRTLAGGLGETTTFDDA